jgi:hypothetical protein
MDIKFLKDTTCRTNEIVRCGDGCCAWRELGEAEDFKAGDVACEYDLCMYDIEEGVDFVYLAE